MKQEQNLSPDITEIDLSNSVITELSDLSSCTKLKILDLSNSVITELPDLSNCTELEILNLSGCKITQIDKDKLPKNIVAIDLSNSGITKLPDLSNCTKLKKLDLRECKNLKEIIGKLPDSLAEIYVVNSGITKLPDLSNCTKLKSLYFGGCGDITIDKFPDNIECIIFRCSGITKLPDLSNCTKLKKLDLDPCKGLCGNTSNIRKTLRLEEHGVSVVFPRTWDSLTVELLRRVNKPIDEAEYIVKKQKITLYHAKEKDSLVIKFEGGMSKEREEKLEGILSGCEYEVDKELGVFYVKKRAKMLEPGFFKCKNDNFGLSLKDNQKAEEFHKFTNERGKYLLRGCYAARDIYYNDLEFFVAEQKTTPYHAKEGELVTKKSNSPSEIVTKDDKAEEQNFTLNEAEKNNHWNNPSTEVADFVAHLVSKYGLSKF